MSLWNTNVWNAYATILLRICVRSITGLTPLKVHVGYSSWPQINLTIVPKYEFCGLHNSVDCLTDKFTMKT